MKSEGFATRISVVLLLLASMAWQPSATRADPAQVEERLARVFQDNMVLQREKPVPIWGWAKPGTQVEVSFGGQKKQATADEHGYWKAILDPMKANREGQVLTAKIGDKVLGCKNVLVGEVWLSAGHSNTGSPGPNVDTGVYPRYVSPGLKAGTPEIRFFSVGTGASMEPYSDFDPLIQGNVSWTTMKEDPGPDSDNVERSDTEYFARILRDKLDVPVGILFLGCVGVRQQTWMSRETLESFPADTGSGNCYQESLAHAEARFAGNPLKSWAGFKKAEDEWRVTHKGRWPPGGDIVDIFGYPTVGYNTRIYPLAPYALRGVRLFAGPNFGTGGAAGLAAMVKQWRKLFGQDFYFINCTSVRYATSPPPLAPRIDVDWTNNAIYESLKLFGGEKREEIAELRDLGDWLSHYLEKAEAGRRLGMAALSLAYGQKQTADGGCPRMAETKIQGGKAVVRFDLVGEGVVYQPSIDGISGVYLRGKDGTGRWAQVKVVGKDTVEFSHPEIVELETVAYGQNTNPHETLFNSAGLPASPFVVNPPKGPANPDPQPPFQIVSMQGEDAKFHILNNAIVKNAKVDLAHVRRNGYVFQIVGDEKVDLALQPIPGKDNNEQMEKSSATIAMTAYIPKEWPDYEVMIGDTYFIRFINGGPVSKGLVKTGGRLVKTTETAKDGARFVAFEAPIDRTWIIVAEKGHAAEFRKINRY